MAMNRVQFQPGLSMAAFLQLDGTEVLCRAALEQMRWHLPSPKTICPPWRSSVSWGKTVWLIKHKLMDVMADRESRRGLTGRVEMDDTSLGGEHSGGKVEWGSEN